MQPPSISEEEIKEREGKEQGDDIPGREENNCRNPNRVYPARKKLKVEEPCYNKQSELVLVLSDVD